MRFTAIVISALTISLLLSTVARSDENGCQVINTSIVTSFVPCPSDFPSPVGLCTAGSIGSGPLEGTTLFRALTFDPGTGLYTGELLITTKHGMLMLADSGQLTATGGFSETEALAGGTRSFKHVIPTLTIQGDGIVTGGSLSGFTGTIAGTICHGSDDENNEQ